MKLLRLSLTLAMVAFFAAPCLAGLPSVRFAEAVNYASGTTGANAVVTVDVNADGFPDLIIATNSGVSVQLNNGDGTFGPPVIYPTGGPFSNALALADVNLDGNLDVVVTNMCLDPTSCSGVAILTGNGDGTFNAPVGYDSGGLETGDVAVGDINNDGAPDLILTSNCQAHTCAGGSLAYVLNNGDGTFAKPVLLAATKGGPVAVGDVNNDGNLDLVTGAGVLLGDGQGDFTSLGPDVPSGAVSIAAIDLNKDGNLDVVAVVPSAGVSVELGDGTGNFSAPTTYKTGGATPLAVAIADFNGDNVLDLAVLNECSHIVSGNCNGLASVGVLPGNGNGTFHAPATLFFTSASLGTSLSAVDVNGDTKVDLVATNACTTLTNCTDGSASVFINNYISATYVTVVASQNPVLPGASVTFTATLRSGSTIPDGATITFYDNSNIIGQPTTVSQMASVTVPFNAGGRYTIKAAYAGDLYHNPSNGIFSELVNKFPSTTTLMSSNSNSTFKSPVTFTAAVTSAEAGGPAGTVVFQNGTTTLGIGTLSGGIATFTTTKLPQGTLTINAVYHGDTQTNTSTGTISQTVN